MSFAKICPDCKKDIVEDASICVNCGLNLKSGKRLVKKEEPSQVEPKPFLWLQEALSLPFFGDFFLETLKSKKKLIWIFLVIAVGYILFAPPRVTLSSYKKIRQGMSPFQVELKLGSGFVYALFRGVFAEKIDRPEFLYQLERGRDDTDSTEGTWGADNVFVPARQAKINISRYNNQIVSYFAEYKFHNYLEDMTINNIRYKLIVNGEVRFTPELVGGVESWGKENGRSIAVVFAGGKATCWSYQGPEKDFPKLPPQPEHKAPVPEVPDQKAQFDKFIADGKQCLEKKDWTAAKNAFGAAAKFAGDKNNSETEGNLKKCQEYSYVTVFRKAVSEGENSLSDNDFEKALKSFEEALKVPGYEGDGTAIKQRDQAKLNVDLKKQFESAMNEGRQCLDRKEWSGAETAFRKALSVPGYATDKMAMDCVKTAVDKIKLEQEALKVTEPVKEIEQPKPELAPQPPVKSEAALKMEEYQKKIDEAKKSLEAVKQQCAQAQIDYEEAAAKYAKDNAKGKKMNLSPSDMKNKKKAYDALKAKMDKISGDIQNYNLLINELKVKEHN